MTQRDRDRLVVLKKAQKKLIQQAQAARELGLTARQVRRLLRVLKEKGDRVVVHSLRGRPSNRKTSQAERDKIVRILSQEVYRGFGPTLLTNSSGVLQRNELKAETVGFGSEFAHACEFVGGGHGFRCAEFRAHSTIEVSAS
jgi:hypothetical protein